MQSFLVLDELVLVEPEGTLIDNITFSSITRK